MLFFLQAGSKLFLSWVNKDFPYCSSGPSVSRSQARRTFWKDSGCGKGRQWGWNKISLLKCFFLFWLMLMPFMSLHSDIHVSIWPPSDSYSSPLFQGNDRVTRHACNDDIPACTDDHNIFNPYLLHRGRDFIVCVDMSRQFVIPRIGGVSNTWLESHAVQQLLRLPCAWPIPWAIVSRWD